MEFIKEAELKMQPQLDAKNRDLDVKYANNEEKTRRKTIKIQDGMAPHLRKDHHRDLLREGLPAPDLALRVARTCPVRCTATSPAGGEAHPIKIR